jgi:hypothetical protein
MSTDPVLCTATEFVAPKTARASCELRGSIAAQFIAFANNINGDSDVHFQTIANSDASRLPARLLSRILIIHALASKIIAC